MRARLSDPSRALSAQPWRSPAKARRSVWRANPTSRGGQKKFDGEMQEVSLGMVNVRWVQRRTSRRISRMSALPPKADIGTQSRKVRFMPKADSCTAEKGLFEARCCSRGRYVFTQRI